MNAARTLPRADFGLPPYGDDPWRLRADATAFNLARTPAVMTLGNGFLGLRGPCVASPNAELYLNGVYERMPINYHEGAHGFPSESDTRIPVCNPSMFRIDVDDREVTDWSSVELDMATGQLRLVARLAGVKITVQRIVMMTANLIATRVQLLADSDVVVSVTPLLASPVHTGAGEAGPLGFGAAYDPRIGNGFAESPWSAVADARDARLDRLPRSGWTVAAAIADSNTQLVSLHRGDQRTIDLFGAIDASCGTDDEGALKRVRGIVHTARNQGFDALAEQQRAWWQALWCDAAVSIPGCPAAEQALRHALFQLVQAAGRDGRTSLAAKGQTGEGYEGHVFWDADVYALPVLAHIVPDTARAMLAWRISHLDEARINARAMGQLRGALYPWRTISGRECSAYFPAGSAQYHINADIAFALRTYIAATGDASLLAEGGGEMLAETARIWLQIGFHDPERGDKFVINRVTGPDEYSALVDNNLYTNLMAAEHLRFAATEAREYLSVDEAETMSAAADTMVVPFDDRRAIPAQDDGFFSREPWPFAQTPSDHYPLLLHYHPLMMYRHAVAKQADAVLVSTLLPHIFDLATRARMLDAYEAITVHDSTLSASAFAVAAARVGDAARAFDYWRLSTLTDICDLFGNSGHGLHMAALAGAWNALVRGFAGMCSDNGLSFAPIAVPELGDYAFALRHHGCRLHVAVGSSTVCYRLEAGGRLAFRHGDELLSLVEGETIERPLA